MCALRPLVDSLQLLFICQINTEVQPGVLGSKPWLQRDHREIETDVSCSQALDEVPAGPMLLVKEGRVMTGGQTQSKMCTPSLEALDSRLRPDWSTQTNRAGSGKLCRGLI